MSATTATSTIAPPTSVAVDGGSALLCALIVLPFASPLTVDAADMGLLALFGVSQFGLGLLLLGLGTPLVSATRGALIGVLQTPLGTLWVWLAFGETPGMNTILGGILVFGAVVANVVIGSRSRTALLATESGMD